MLSCPWIHDPSTLLPEKMDCRPNICALCSFIIQLSILEEIEVKNSEFPRASRSVTLVLHEHPSAILASLFFINSILHKLKLSLWSESKLENALDQYKSDRMETFKSPPPRFWSFSSCPQAAFEYGFCNSIVFSSSQKGQWSTASFLYLDTNIFLLV